MSTVKMQNEFLLDFCQLIQYADSIGFIVTPGEIERTIDQQRIYFANGRSKTMNSRHLVKMAGDLNFFKHGVYINSLPAIQAIKILKPIGTFWESLSPLNRWGGNFDMDWIRPDRWHDIPHFERLDG